MSQWPHKGVDLEDWLSEGNLTILSKRKRSKRQGPSATRSGCSDLRVSLNGYRVLSGREDRSEDL